MKCDEAIPLLVAFSDGELSASQRLMTEAHLRRCTSCSDHLELLDACTPIPLRPSVADLGRMHSRVDPDAIFALVEERAKQERTERLAVRRSSLFGAGGFGRWVWRDTELPMGAIVAYAAILVLVLGWGVQRHRTASALEARFGPTPFAQPASAQIPSDHYRPASYSAERNMDQTPDPIGIVGETQD